MEKRKKRADETEGRVGARDCPLAAGGQKRPLLKVIRRYRNRSNRK